MYRIVNWQPFHLAGTPVLTAVAPGFTQETGAGAGYHLNRFILANFAFFYTPTHPSEVIYQFAKSDPVLDYEIRAEFFNKVGAYLKQKIAVLGLDIEVPAGRNEVDWFTLPRESFENDHVWIRQRQ